MASTINTNTPSLIAQNNSRKTNNSLNQSLQRVSTGQRINSAKDDAAGLAIANRFATQINQSNQSISNLSAGVSMVQTAEGGLSSITESLQRMRELAVNSANGTNSASDRRALQSEFSQLQQSIGTIVDTTRFNGDKVLSNTQIAQIAVDGAGDSIDVNLRDINQESGISETLSTASISTASESNLSIASIDAALEEVGTIQAEYGAALNRFEYAANAAESASISAASARSRIADTDIASEMAQNIRSQILTQANIAVQGHANAQPGLVLKLLTG